MGAPKNFYNAVDLAKFGIEDIDKRVLPKVTAANNGKIAKVVEGKWALGDDVNTASVKYIYCTTGVFDGVTQIVLPEGVTVLSLYEMVDNGVLPIIVCPSNSGDRRFVLTSVLTGTYQGTDYVTLSFASSSYGARRKIDGVYTYYIFNNYITTFSSYYDNEKSIDYSTARCNTYPKAVFGGTLTAGNTTLEISDSLIKADCLIDVYTDVFGVDPTNIVVVNGKATLTFEAQASDLNVRIEVSLI